jgi:hypothetical protein
MADPKHPRRNPESGFALLLVFLMAAIVAITLYNEIPRVAFQSQRQKEQLLMARGEQYKRAIQLYVRATHRTRYPADIDDLDRGINNMRFLRHRYKDPMTGKDEWRLIHIQAGMLTDSKVTQNSNNQNQQQGGSTGNISEMTGITDLQSQGQTQPVNAATRRRPSENGNGPTSMGGDNPAPADGSAPQDTANGATPGAAPNSPVPPQGPSTSGTPTPGAPTPTQPGAPTPGQQPNSAAMGMLNQIITGPRPGGMAGLNPRGNTIGGGMAGVASTADADSIMVYNDQTNYSDWEFVYDSAKDTGLANPMQGTVGTKVQDMSAPANGAPGFTQGNAFGSAAGGSGQAVGSALGQGSTPNGQPGANPGGMPMQLPSDSTMRPGKQ